VNVNGVKVVVTLTLKPGTTVEQANDASRDSDLRGPETGTAADSKPGQVTGMDAGQRVPDK
jgi:hypothetical protein